MTTPEPTIPLSISRADAALLSKGLTCAEGEGWIERDDYQRVQALLDAALSTPASERPSVRYGHKQGESAIAPPAAPDAGETTPLPTTPIAHGWDWKRLKENNR